MEIVDLRDRRDEELLRVLHDGLYVTSFPLEDEREGLDYWRTALWGGGQGGHGPSVHALVAGTDLGEPGRRRIAGFAFVELYLESGCGLLSYLAVDPNSRRAGHGRELVRRGLETLRRDAEDRGKPLRAVFAEVHDPDAAKQNARDEVMDPTERVSFFAKLGGRHIPIPYVQPALAQGRNRARGLQLIVFCSEDKKGWLPSAVVRDFVAELYELSEGNPSPRDREFRAMTSALAAESIQLQPLNAIIEEPALTVARYGIAFEFVTRGEGKLPEPAEQFASFEADLVSYAFQDEDRRPFASQPVHVDDPCRQVEVEFAPEVRFLSEGRTCALVTKDAPPGGRRVWLQVRASWTQFRTGVTVWHLVLTPRAGSADAALSEYDIIKLAKHWTGGEAIKGPFTVRDAESAVSGDESAVSRAESAVRFSKDEQTWTLSQLADAVTRGKLKGASPRAGIIQLITGDHDPKVWREAWEVIRAAKKEPAIDTSFPFKRPKQRLLVESIAGVIQTLIDFREIDDAELRDVLAGMDVGEDGLQGVHKGTLLYMAASDRTWNVSKLSYGISPYLLLPHAALLHNEEILRTAAAAVQEEREAVEKLTTARGALGRPSKRGWLSHLIRMPLLALAFAQQVRKERKTLRAAREELHRALQRDYLPNVFHYPNERHIYEVGETSRGLAALAQELRESLEEFDARWEGGASMRRTMADDIKAGLLFAIAGFALKDYLNPVALVAIFGFCGLIYVGFRFYTWR
jgi:GNAT superfamily N-acetyltransferase